MAFFDTLARLLRGLLLLVVWALAALAGLAVLGLGLSALLIWLLINRLRGRPAQVNLKARFADLRRGAMFDPRQAGDKLWPTRPHGNAADGRGSDAPTLARRMGKPVAVEDVQARDLPSEPPR